MTIENANKARDLLDEKECLEFASEKLSDYLGVRVEISVTNPSPSSAWVRDYVGEFVTKDIVRRMKNRISEIEQEISKL